MSRTNFMSAKMFWSSSEALLSDVHQQTLIYDFLVNIAVTQIKVD